MQKLIITVTLVFLVCSLYSQSIPQWIWDGNSASPALSAPAGQVTFKRVFYVEDKENVSSATLYASSDNTAECLLNGKLVGDVYSWSQFTALDVTDYLIEGKNELIINASNQTEGPAGLIIELKIINADNDVSVTVISDAKWLSLDPGSGDWIPVTVVGPNGMSPWGLILQEGAVSYLPEFTASGHDLTALNRMVEEFYPAAKIESAGTFVMAWLPRAMLWAANGNLPGKTPTQLRTAARLSNMLMDAEGYVSCHQHEGLAHSLGWPFPLPSQSGGIGYYFSLEGIIYGPEFGVHSVTDLSDWGFTGVKPENHSPGKGLNLSLTEPNAFITSPEFKLNAQVAPFIRIKWDSSGLPPGSEPWLEWTTEKETTFSRSRRASFPPPSPSLSSAVIQDFDIPLFEYCEAGAVITRLRIGFGNPSTGKCRLLRIFSAVDSRHSVNNANFIIGSADYIDWTGDFTWLKKNLPKLRQATKWMIKEFSVRQEHLVSTPWVGHDGRSGIHYDEVGKKHVLPGVGVGGNYWDLLPFGGKDPLATIYLYHALVRMAGIERWMAKEMPEISVPEPDLSATELLKLSNSVRNQFQNTFWNEKTQRFSPVDADGVFRDYGFTFLNNEAMFYGLATPHQADQVLSWLNGDRIVDSDTSKGDDIYYWRFAPRATTRRNLDYYAYVWSVPERLEFGDQVQDGGAVFGFSYHDLMNRLHYLGAGDAWERFKEILSWYQEVDSEGGPRSYYSTADRGKLQGGGTAGGLGIDEEFYESVMVTPFVLEGFLGFRPTIEGLSLNPKLPSELDSLRLTRIAYKGMILDIEATQTDMSLSVVAGKLNTKLQIVVPQGTEEINVKYSDNDLWIKTDFEDRKAIIQPGNLEAVQITLGKTSKE